MDISDKIETLLITGGAGFIGSHFVDLALAQKYRVVVYDKLTYAGTIQNLQDAQKNPYFQFFKADILDREAFTYALNTYKPTQIVHFAAESHVDRSIEGPEAFLQTNVVGTFRLIDESKKYYEQLPASLKEAFRFYHISTDEVFGSLEGDAVFKIDDPYRPNSPYSASKAASDLFVRAYFETYKLPAITSNCTNNFGPRQHHEKLIPTVIRSCFFERKIPVYGNGKNQRDWIYVYDHCDGIMRALKKGRIGEVYGFAGNKVLTNLQLVEMICAAMDQIRPRKNGAKHSELISFVEDRKGHDFRYALDDSKAVEELGYAEKRGDFSQMLKSTVESYVNYYTKFGDWKP